MPKKLTSFNDVLGNQNTVEFIKSHLARGTMPTRIIFEGEEGLGKTSLAKLIAMGINCSGEIKPCYKCPSCRQIIHDVIENNKNTDSVQVYNMSVDSGKDAAKNVKQNLTAAMSPTGKKVIICDEAHGMSDAAQDVFLVDMEYLPKGVYLIFCTTNSQNLKKTLKSRTFTIHLNRPKKADLVKLLAEVAAENKLTIQGGNVTLSLIADWAECKPRQAINLLEGFGKDTSVSSALIKELTGYIDTSTVIPILDSLAGSLTLGLAYAQEMPMNPAIIDVLSDILTVKLGGNCYKFSVDDLRTIKIYLTKISTETLITFLRALTRQPVLTRALFVNALLEAHPSGQTINKYDPGVLQEEKQQASEAVKPTTLRSEATTKAPTLDSLLRSANQIKKDG